MQRTFNVGLKKLKQKLQKNKAVIVCHIGGEAADIIPIKRYLKEKNYLNRRLFSVTWCRNKKSEGRYIWRHCLFSTMSSKLHSTGGQGAVIFSKNRFLIDRVISVSDRGKIFNNEKFIGKYNYLGINSNLDELSAAIGCVQIDKLNKIITRTNYIGEYIKRKLNKLSITMNVGEQIKDSRNVYWFVRVSIDLSKIHISKIILQSSYC